MPEFNDRRTDRLERVRALRGEVQARAKKRGVKMGWSTAHMVASNMVRQQGEKR